MWRGRFRSIVSHEEAIASQVLDTAILDRPSFVYSASNRKRIRQPFSPAPTRCPAGLSVKAICMRMNRSAHPSTFEGGRERWSVPPSDALFRRMPISIPVEDVKAIRIRGIAISRKTEPEPLPAPEPLWLSHRGQRQRSPPLEIEMDFREIDLRAMNSSKCHAMSLPKTALPLDAIHLQ